MKVISFYFETKFVNHYQITISLLINNWRSSTSLLTLSAHIAKFKKEKIMVSRLYMALLNNIIFLLAIIIPLEIVYADTTKSDLVPNIEGALLIQSSNTPPSKEPESEFGSQKSIAIESTTKVDNPQDVNGAFVYSLTIDVPPGVRLATPLLEVQYNSMKGYSALGQGWYLTNQSEITRCNSSRKFDGFSAPPAKNDKDALCLDSERLLLRSGIHLQIGAIYRLERKPGIQVVIIASPEDPNQIAFRLDAGDSSQHFYGLGNNALLKYPQSAVTRTWALTKKTDPYGNEVRYSYDTFSENGEIVLKEILYGEMGGGFSRSILFEYTDEVRDTLAIIGGARKEITKILKSIITQLNGLLVHKYEFAYKIISVKQKSLLQSITKCGPHSCLPPTLITWYAEDEVNHKFDSEVISKEFHGKGKFGWFEDLNGDGLRDYVTKTDDLCIHWVLKTSNGWATRQTQCELHGAGEVSWLMDINGDGLPDYITKTKDDYIHWNINTGKGYENASAFGTSQSQRDLHGIGVSMWMIDINSDGLPDYVTKTNDANIHWNLNLGGSWGPRVTQSGIDKIGNDRWLRDINGDGLPDYVVKTDDLNIHWNLNIFKDGVTSALFGSSQTQEIHGLGVVRWLVDINGDDLPDYVAKNSDGNLHWNINNGNGWNLRKTQSKLHGLGAISWFADVDGDGYLDYVAKNDDGWIHWNLNRGFGYDTENAFSPNESQSLVPGLGSDRWLTDINGDGRADYVAIDANLAVHVASAIKGNSPELINRIQSITGNLITVEYTPLNTASDFYKITAPRNPGDLLKQLVNLPNSVVNSITRTTGNRQPLITKYYYENACFNLIENRWLGFSKIIAVDTFRNTQHTREFHQIYPFEGLWTRDTLFNENQIILSDNLATWALSPESLFGSYPILKQKIETHFTTEGDFEKRIIVSNEYNQYAQAIESKVNASDNIQRSIKLDLSNNEVMWRMGRINKETEILRTSSGQQNKVERKYERNEAGDVINLELIRTAAVHERERLTYTSTGLIETRSLSESTSLSERVWLYSYDSYGYLKNKNGPINHLEEYTFDPRFGVATSYKIDGLIRHEAAYDEFGRITRKNEASGNQELIHYSLSPDKGSFTVATQSSIGLSRQETYDSSGALINLSSKGFGNKNVISNYHYDAAGRLTLVSLPRFEDEASLSTIYKYDVLDREINRIYPWGESIQTTYNALSRSTFSNSKLKSVTTFDTSDQIIEAKESGGSLLQLELDPGSRVRQAEVDNSLFSTYTLDGASRITAAYEPGRGTRSFTWSAFGEMLTEITPSGQTIESTYDKLGRTLLKTSGEEFRKWRYEKNDSGTITYAKSSDGISDKIEFDKANKVINEVRTIGVSNYRLGRIYDSFGRLINLKLPGNLPDLHYSYSPIGELHSISLGSTKRELWRVVERDAQGRITQQKFGDKINSEIIYEEGREGFKALKVSTPQAENIINQEWSRDFHGNVLSITDNIKRAQTFVTYDELDRIKTVTNSQAFNSSILESRQYTYNKFGDIISNDTLRYNYADSIHGRLLTNITLGSHLTPSLIAEKYYFKYDEAGNTIFDKKRRYSYNDFGELKKINYAGRNIECRYKYDSNGILAIKKCNSLSIQVDNELEVEEHNFNNLFFRISRSGYRRDQFLIYAGDRLVAILFSSITKLDKQNNKKTTFHPTTQAVLFPQTDHNGTILALLDESGSVVAEYKYSAFGERVVLPSSKKILQHNFPFGFHGHYHDSETDLLKVGYRYFEPVISRFIVPDPATDFSKTAQLINRYSFALNNPLRFTDSTGLYIDKDGNERAGPAHPDPERHQYTDWDAFERGNAGVYGYDNPQEGIRYGYDRNSGRVLSEKGLKESVLDPIDFIGLLNTKSVLTIGKSFFEDFGRILFERNAPFQFMVKEGVYWFKADSGKMYVGQSKDVAKRLVEHMKSGKLTQENIGSVQVSHVPGGKIHREIAEQNKINQLGGIKVLDNVRNAVGAKRIHLLRQ